MTESYSPGGGYGWRELSGTAFCDRWDRPWNTLGFLALNGFLWLAYGYIGYAQGNAWFDWPTMLLAVATAGSLFDLSDKLRIPRSVSFLDDRIELERLFLSKLTWATSGLEVQEKAGGLTITNTRSPERSHWLNTIVVPGDYPRLEEIRELLTERVALPRKE